MGPRARIVTLSGLWMLLGGWIGAMLFFGAAVAPAAFAVLPTPELAGRLVSRSLAILNLSGAVAGVGLALLARALGRRPALVALPLLLAAACLLSHFGVSAALAELREGGALAGEAQARAGFARLHQLSVGLFSIVLGGASLLLVLHVRADAPLFPSPQSPRKNAGNP